MCEVHRRRRLRVFLVCALGGAAAGSCTTESVHAPPVVVNFSASGATIVSGASVVLGWSVTGADTVQIDQGIGEVVGTLLSVAPATTTTYTLTALNSGGTATATVVVRVAVPSTEPPDPAGFSAFSTAGGGILLAWQAEPMAGSYSIEVSSNLASAFVLLAEVPGARYFSNGGPTMANNVYTYRLRSVNDAGTSPGVTASAISAPPPPEGPVPIAVAPASSVSVARGGSVQLTASVAVAWRVLDGPGGGSIDASGLYTAPAGPGTFRVAATNGGFAATVAIVVP
jgi:hypothetical protein